jgi:sialic acid synthase SpsE
MTCKVIAECGVNFHNLEEAKQMIAAASNAGAFAVKFQLFKKMTIRGSPYEEQLRQLILSKTDVADLHKCAEENDIKFVLTTMYQDAVAIAAEFADYIKIRFKDHEDAAIINAAMDTGKPLLISVPRPPIDPRLAYSTRIYPLWCIPRYPPEPEDFNIDQACACKGVSLHFPHCLFDLAFAINRIYDDAFIEKHVMFDMRVHIDNFARPIDEKVSVTFEELKNFISQLELIERMKRTRL